MFRFIANLLVALSVVALGQMRILEPGEVANLEDGIRLTSETAIRINITSFDDWPAGTPAVPIGPVFRAVSPYYLITLPSNASESVSLEMRLPSPATAKPDLITAAISSPVDEGASSSWSSLLTNYDLQTDELVFEVSGQPLHNAVIVLRQPNPIPTFAERARTLEPGGIVAFPNGITVSTGTVSLTEPVLVGVEEFVQTPVSLAPAALYKIVSPYYDISSSRRVRGYPGRLQFGLPIPEGADPEELKVLVFSPGGTSLPLEMGDVWLSLRSNINEDARQLTFSMGDLWPEGFVFVLAKSQHLRSDAQGVVNRETRTLAPGGSVAFFNGVTVTGPRAGLEEAVEISAEVSEQWPLSRREPGKPFTFVSPYYTISSSREVRGGFAVGLPVPKGLDPSSLSVYFFSPGEQSSSDFYDDLWLSHQSRYDAETNTLVISESAFHPNGSVFVLAKP